MIEHARQPRILMLSDVYFPRVNGVSTSIQTFRSDLDALGWPTRLIAPRYPQDGDDDARILRIPSRAVPLDPEDRLMHARRLLAACRALAGKIDLIHIQTPFLAHWAGVKLAGELRLPTVETYHTYFEQYFHHYASFLPDALLQWFARRISRTQCNAVDVVIAPSAPMAEVLRAYGIRAPIEIIGTGLDLARFQRGDGRSFRAAQGIDADRPVVLHVGRIAHEKNIGFLVDVFADVRQRLPEALFVIAGEGPAVRSLRSKVAAMGLADSVRFVGYLARDGALLDCYRSANAFVFASNTETQGLVLLEAMAVGTPVVSTAVLGTKDVLGRGPGGAIVVPEDRERFAAAVISVLENSTMQAELGAAGRRCVREHWSAEAMARRLIEIYRRLSGGRTFDDGAEARPGSTSAVTEGANHGSSSSRSPGTISRRRAKSGR